MAEELGLTVDQYQLLQASHVACRLNGFLAGVGGVKEFDEEALMLGLTQEQIAYIREEVKKNEGTGLYCG